MQGSAGDDVTANGATDLTDSNMAEPGTTHDESADETNDDSNPATVDDDSVEAASGDQGATTTDASIGSDEGFGGGESSAESD